VIEFSKASGRVLLFCSSALLTCFHAREARAAFEESPSIQCDIQAICGLWPDKLGGFAGASAVEWNDCSDANEYRARCLHHGSGQTMEACRCEVSGVSLGDRKCAQSTSEDDLVAASRACCGFPMLEAR
jgi:hypothetical protein